jgi:hypothetical protein
MSRRKKPQIQTADQALIFLDYWASFVKGDSAKRFSEIATVIRDLVDELQGDDAEWIYLGSPTDVVKALLQRAWDDDVSDDDRTLFERGATALQASLDRNVHLASVIEKTEAGL